MARRKRRTKGKMKETKRGWNRKKRAREVLNTRRGRKWLKLRKGQSYEIISVCNLVITKAK